MRKYILCVVILFVFLLTACGEIEQPVLSVPTDASPTGTSEISTEPQKPTEDNYPKEVQFILDRDIFLLKNDFPELYTSSINNIDQIIAYVENWDLHQILNTENFKDIDWQVTLATDGVKTVTFTGIPHIIETATYVTIEFYVQEGAKVPLAWSITPGNSSSGISVQDFLNQGMDVDAAVLSADASVSCMVAIMSEAAAMPASEYYEALADEYLGNGEYDHAIEYYEKANTTGDKLSAAYYAKGESCLASGDLDSAEMYFKYAGNYKDSPSRVREVFYKAGAQHEKNKDYISAICSYSKAGDYSDSRAKYKECNYKQGALYMSNKQYLDAASCFEEAANYTGAAEKYQEACYLYADQQLLAGSVDTASVYFSKAGNYKDAATRIVNYYYEKGVDYLASKEYLRAAEHFIHAETYSDARTLVSECYYCYGKQQFELNYISEAIEYLSKCRGYKDTDEILLSYYYGEATFAFDGFLDAFASGDNYSISQWFDKATEYLTLCEGYKDSNNLLKVTDKLYNAKKYLANISNQYGVLSLKGMSVSVNGNVITLDVPSWTTDASVVCSMILNYDMSSNTFTATLKNMYFNQSVVSRKNTKMVESLLLLFTDLEKLEEFVAMYSDETKWTATWKNYSPGYMQSGSTALFSIAYGGYEISIDVKLENARLEWTISANK